MADILKLVCGWIGACLALFFFLSPIVPMIKLIKKEVKVNTIPVVMLIFNVLNCTLWFSYGLYIEEYPVWVCNGVGAIITSIWIIIYWVFFAELKWIPALIYNLLYINIIGELYYIVHVIAGEENNGIIGWVAMAVNILMYAAPGAQLVKFYKTGDLNLLPIYSLICSLVNSTFWTIYGITLDDFTIIVPNALGIAFAIFQIIFWVVVWRRNKKKPQSQQKDSPQTEEVRIDIGVTPGGKSTAEEQSKASKTPKESESKDISQLNDQKNEPVMIISS